MEDNALHKLRQTAERILPPEFELLGPLGQGGFGSVYKANHRNLSSFVAIKFIVKDQFESDEKAIDNFHNEAKVIARLDHPNIVKILQVGKAIDGTLFLVYEYLEGETLKSYLERKKKLSVRSLQCLLTQLINALSHAHDNGVIHRDIKPSNIMLMPEVTDASLFQIKLLDFGSANTTKRVEADTAKTQGTSSLNAVGSPAYMSPEQCRAEKVDERADIYSVACLIYECLEGRPPFQADSNLELMYKQINEAPPLPSRNFPKVLNALLSDCLAKKTCDRPANCEELRQRLHPALKSLEKFVMPNSNGKQKAVVLSISLILVVLVLAFYFASTNSSRTSANFSTTTVPRVLAVRRHPVSPEARLKNIASMYHNEKTPGIEKFAASIAELEELRKFARGRRTWLFTCYWLEAMAYLRLGKSDEAKKALLQAVRICKLSDGKYAKEAAQCFRYLAQFADSKNPDECISYCKNALAIVNHLENVEQLGVENEPYEILDLTPVKVLCLRMLVLNYIARNELPDAETYAKQALKASSEYITFAKGDSEERLLLATVHHKQGKKTSALAEVLKLQESLTDLSKENVIEKDESDRNSRVCFINDVANWLNENQYTKEAEKAYEDAVDMFNRLNDKEHQLDNRVLEQAANSAKVMKQRLIMEAKSNKK